MFSVLAVDRYGNPSEWRTVAPTEPVDEAFAEFRGTWTIASDANAWAGTLSGASQVGATFTFGSRVLTGAAAMNCTAYVVGEQGPDHGTFAVEVDGQQVQVVDTEAAVLAQRAVLTRVPLADCSRGHTVTVRVLDAGPRTLVVVDAYATGPIWRG